MEIGGLLKEFNLNMILQELLEKIFPKKFDLDRY